MRQKLSVQIDSKKISDLIQVTFSHLPSDYSRLLTKFINCPNSSYFRDSSISKWIAIPTTSSIIFRQFETPHRLINIHFETVRGHKTELQVYLGQHGIFGMKLGENLEDILVGTIDTSKFIIEEVTFSQYFSGYADLEYLDLFNELEDFLDDSSEIYKIDKNIFFSIITLSDRNCIAIDEKNSVYLLNNETGHTKLLAKRPEAFVHDFQNGTLDWLDNVK